MVSAHLRVFTGQKEIVMFFYMHVFIELLAFFLDSGVIPLAHVSSAPTDLQGWSFPQPIQVCDPPFKGQNGLLLPA